MGDNLDLLNQNSGVLMVILTLAYVISTILILRSQEKTRIGQMRPNIIIQINGIRNGLYALEICNVGNSVAKNISITLPDNLVEMLHHGQEKFSFQP